MEELQNIIKFYHDCYQIDQKGVRNKNFMSSQCEKRFVPINNDLFHQSDFDILIDTQWARGKCYCVDLIGYPGEFEEQFSLASLRILNRMSTPVFFLPYTSWYLDKEKTQTDLLKFIAI